jgi:hypothetical protein
MDPTGATTASWLQTGGVIAFAAAVLWELRQLRPLIKGWIEERQRDRDLLSEVKIILGALLERERMRGEQRAKLIKQGRLPPDDAPDEAFDDITDNVSLPEQKPKRQGTGHTPPAGYPIGGYSKTRGKTRGEE